MNAVISYHKLYFAARATVERAAHRADETTHWSVKQWRVEVLKLLIGIKEAYRAKSSDELPSRLCARSGSV